MSLLGRYPLLVTWFRVSNILSNDLDDVPSFSSRKTRLSLIHRCHAQLWVGRRGPFQLEHSTTPEDSRRLIRVLKCSPTIYLFICTRPTSYFHERGHIRSLMPRSHQKFLSPPAVKLLGDYVQK